MTVNQPKIVLCIPGRWSNHEELVASITELEKGYFLIGNFLLKTGSDDPLMEIEFCDRDDRMFDAFAAAGHGRISSTELDDIKDHQSVVYILNNENGHEAVQNALAVAAPLLEAGGIGLKIETAGVAHSREYWNDLLNRGDVLDVFETFIVKINDEDALFTCGMYNFNLPDISVKDLKDRDQAHELINVFALYLFDETPTILDGHTFSIDEDAPHFVLQKIPDEAYPKDSVFYNPLGRWQLSPKT